MRDIDIVKKELPLDLLEFFYLTPLPGSEDHKKLHEAGEWMDADMNKYDLNHRVSRHPTMSDIEWERAYSDAWDKYYSPDHMATVMRRMASTGKSPSNVLFLMMMFAGSVKIEGVHPLESGFWRRKVRVDRRPGMPIVPAWKFYPALVADLLVKHGKWIKMFASIAPQYLRIKRDPNRLAYSDKAMEATGDNQMADLDMIMQTRGGEQALAKMRSDTATRAAVHAKVLQDATSNQAGVDAPLN